MDGPAYLDNAATTPLCPEALAAMLPFLTEHFGNPSGPHSVARRARRAVEEAREELASCLAADPAEVFFTSGGTEADNLAVTGLAGSGTVVCSAVEHQAVLAPTLACGGRLVGVGGDARVDLDQLAAVLDGSVSLVSVMLANNEVGVVQPLADVAEVTRERAPGAVLHTDAVHAFPWLDVASLAAPFDIVTVSAHKFGGPKGAGAVVVRGRASGTGPVVEPLLRGGGQERGLRSGTHDVAGIVGMAAAARAVAASREETVRRIAALRDRLAEGLLGAVAGLVETVPRDAKVAGSLHVQVPGVEGEELVALLDDMGVCASSGSACSSGASEPSHVLLAMGLPPARAASALRLSLGAATTDAEVDRALEVVPKAVAQLRG
jgi:cysteine desulfurase